MASPRWSSVIASGTGTRDDPYQTAPFDWTYPAAFAILADVQGGARAVPTEAELIAERPVIGWPE